MKLGADPKKIWILGGLLVLGGYLFYSNVISQSGPSQPAKPSGAVAHNGPPPPVAPEYSEAPAPARRPTASSRTSDEFRPSLKPRRPEDRIDPMSIDPTLRTDLLAKVQAVELQGGNRNLFQFGAPPPPPLPKEPIVPVKTVQQVAAEKAQAEAAKGPPPPPPPPPILLKYYGYSSARGDVHKHAFFLDGDEILVAAEGELVKKRYRVVRIGVNSVVMEDTQFKHEQTLPLAEEAAG